MKKFTLSCKLPPVNYNGYVIAKKDFRHCALVVSDEDDRFEAVLNISPNTTRKYVARFNAWGEWKHLAFTYDRDEMKIRQYIDGRLTKEHKFSHPINTTNESLQIGRRLPSNYYFSGVIDDIRLYNRALSSTEIQHLYDTTRLQ